MKTAKLTCALLVAAGCWIAPSAAVAQPDTVPGIVVHAAHYVFNGTVFVDLGELEHAVGAYAPSGIAIDACGAAATQALKAAAHRFHRLPLRLQVLNPEAAPCGRSVTPIPRGQRVVLMPAGIDDAEVEHYWRRVMP